MKFLHSAILFSLGLGALTLASSCSADGEGDPNGGGSGGAASACVTDFTNAAAGETISLRNDLMPIFGLSCTASQCHNADDKKADLYLGVRCAFDENAKWRCTFPETATTTAQPLTQAIVDEVYASLTKASTTASTVQLVTPGSPDTSFLMDKLINKQNDKGYACTKQDSRAIGECGDLMPLNSSFCSQGTGPSKVAAFAAWIAQGARNN